MPPAALSNIRAFVHWKDPAVYAGEEIECIITFKNVAAPPGGGRGAEAQPSSDANGTSKGRKASLAPSLIPSRKSSLPPGKVPLSRAPSVTNARAVPSGRGHRPALSLNIVSAPSKAGLQSAPLPVTTPGSTFKSTRGHGRSLSIMSLGSEVGSDGRGPTTNAPVKRPPRPHSRSASLQQLPRPLPVSSQSAGGQTPRHPSPLYESTVPSALPEAAGQALPIRPIRRKPGVVSAGNTPTLGTRTAGKRQSSTDSSSSHVNSFRFPAPQSPDATSNSEMDPPKPARSPSNMHSGINRPHSPRAQEWSGMSANLHPISRVMSESSVDNTPRSSVEFYSMSNHSDETLTSEAPSQQQTGRLLPKPPQSRTASKTTQRKPPEPETLMMAYAQTTGSFTLDGSLVNAAPFEEVKRKGVQGGGGVVGYDRPKRSSGVFGAFSWGNIGESLGGLLGGDEMSSMAQMKANAGSKAIPLLSTPQSLLFVDLKLAPGQSRSYNYRFSLPRGLPPSYKGRAIKINYHLSIGVQRPEGQAVKNVEIPFRVLGSYDSRGDILGHDLMIPYVLLQDAARTASIAPEDSDTPGHPRFASIVDSKKPKKAPKQGLEDFLRYTERLVGDEQDSSGVLLSPTSPSSPNASRQHSLADQLPEGTKEIIDFAILRSNHAGGSGKTAQNGAQSANRFNIARSGQPVAVLTMLRPAYRVGEAVIGTINFTAPLAKSGSAQQVSTYSVSVELESAEQVDPSLSLRSSGSINRVTRKVHGAMRENTLFARQLSFNLSIPSTATPTFETTGVSLSWRLKLEFTTQRQTQGLGIDKAGTTDPELLEELATDDRGTTYIAKELLMADTFEVVIPLKVYGAMGVDAMSDESEALIV